MTLDSESNDRTYFFAVVFTILLAYFSILKAYTNTYHLPRAIREERSRNKLEDLYDVLFDRRGECSYHFEWAKTRSDRPQMEALASKIQELDCEIDLVENNIVKMYQLHGVKFARL